MSGVPMHVSAQSVPVYLFDGEHRFRFLATGAQTAGSYGVMEVISPAGSGSGPHTHEDSEEHFLIRRGEVVFDVDGQTYIAKAGDLVHVPRRTLHEFTVTTDATMMATFTPAGDEQLLLDGSVLLQE